MKIEGLSFSYKNNHIFEGLSTTFRDSKANVIVGKNGIGKTTLLDIIAGLEKPDAGSLTGFPRPDEIMYVFQDVPFNNRITVMQLLKMYQKVSGDEERTNFHRIPEMEEVFDETISMMLSKKLGILSGGERRLIFIFAAALLPKKLYLFDEPLAGIDIGNQRKIIKLLLGLSKCHDLMITSHNFSMFTDDQFILSVLGASKMEYRGIGGNADFNLIEKELTEV